MFTKAAFETQQYVLTSHFLIGPRTNNSDSGRCFLNGPFRFTLLHALSGLRLEFCYNCLWSNGQSIATNRRGFRETLRKWPRLDTASRETAWSKCLHAYYFWNDAILTLTIFFATKSPCRYTAVQSIHYVLKLTYSLIFELDLLHGNHCET